MKELISIQSELKAPKSNYNNFGRYNYRSSEDILEALKPLLNKYKCYLLCNSEPLLIGERYYIKVYVTLYNSEGQSVSTTSIAREELSKKGMDASQLSGATESYAKKYALGNLFAIDDNKDSDSTNKHEKSTNKPTNEPEKDWLNKGTEQFTKVVEAMKNGYTIEQVRSKYKVSKEVEKLLTDK